MKILFFSHSNTFSYGAEKSLYELATTLSKKFKIDCNIVVPKEGQLVEKLNEKNVTVINIDYQWWCSFKPCKKEEQDRIMMNSYKNIIRSLEKVDEINPDIIITNTAVIPWGAICAQRLNIPHIWFIREFGEIDHGLNFYLPFKEIIEIIYYSSNHILCNSFAVRDYLFGNYNLDKVSVAYHHDINLEKNYKENVNIKLSPSESFKVITIGRITEGKGTNDAVNSVIKLIQEGFNIELFLVGGIDDPYANYLIKRVEKKQLSHKIHFLGFIKNVKQIIDFCDVGLTCSNNEAFGRSTVEMMMCGKPVIGKSSGGTTEIIEHGKNGFLYHPDSNDELEKYIKYFIHNPDQIKKFGDYAVRSIKEKLNQFPGDKLLIDACNNHLSEGNLESKKLIQFEYNLENKLIMGNVEFYNSQFSKNVPSTTIRHNHVGDFPSNLLAILETINTKFEDIQLNRKDK